MADKNVKSYSIRMKFGTGGSLRSLIKNASLTIKNSAWRIQYG